MKLRVLLEIAFVFFSTEISIWMLDGMGWVQWLGYAIPILSAINSCLKNGESWESLGIKPASWRKDLIRILGISSFFWLIIFLIALNWNPDFLKSKDLLINFSRQLIFYYPGAWLQNLALNGYFVNRLAASAKKSPFAISLIVGIFFSATHWPNPVLIIATLTGGTMSAYFFQRNKNLYWLATAHSVLAVSLLYFFPDSWHHHLMVGPGFWRWHQK